MAMIGIYVAERCRVSWLFPPGCVNCSCWQWYSIVIRGEETRVDRYIHLGMPKLLGVTVVLPVWADAYQLSISDGLLRSCGTVAAQYAICSSVLDGRKHSMALLCSWRGAMQDGLGGVQLGGV